MNRFCRICGKPKPPGRCQTCRSSYMKQYRENNAEALREQRKKWDAEHPDSKRKSDAKYRFEHHEACLEAGRIWRRSNKNRHRAYSREYAANHKEKHNENRRRWVAENPEKAREIRKRQYQKIMATERGKLRNSISSNMRSSIKNGSKAGRTWESLVGYTIDQLKRHIEKQFTPGMSWKNYGIVWEIDHKIPIAVFNYEKPEDIDFRLCWSLRNLQPLEKTANRIKSDRVKSPFQPSLRLSI